jgi:hypothetical protein
MSRSIGGTRAAFFSLFVLGVGSCGPDWLTVREAQQQASSLDGKRVRVRGYAGETIVTTAIACQGTNQCCNSAAMNLYLMPTASMIPISANWDASYIKVYRQGLHSYICDGDECSLTCSPIQPARQHSL